MPRNSSPGLSLPAKIWALTSKSAVRYHEIDGEQRAASFAYYAFFSLFPLIVLLVTTIGSSLLKDQQQAAHHITEEIGKFAPISDADKLMIVNTIDGVIKSRGSAGIVAFVTLAWSSLRFFQALVRGINRAWHTREYAWWHLPIKNLGMVGIIASALVLNTLLPTILKVVRGFIPYQTSLLSHITRAGEVAIPLLILFYALTLFYKYAPQRAITLRDVLLPALVTTGLLKLLQYLFGIYLVNYSNFNVIYGTFAGVMALLLWIYLSGAVIIYGGCLCAVRAELAFPAGRPPRKRGRKSA